MNEKYNLIRRGQLHGHADVILSNAAQLARWLGVAGLDRPTDNECAALVSRINNLTDEAFREGWDAMSLYNHDHRLLCEGWLTNH